MSKTHRRRFMQLAASAVSLSPRLASAQSYPARAVRVIVPFAPGGQTDVIARLLSQKLSDRLGQQFYVENKPGAGGNIGTSLAAQATPDGYTLLFTDGTSFVVNPNLYEKVPYDPFKDFQPVSLAVTTTQVLVVHPDLPVKTIAELVALVKAKPGTYSIASPGIGTPGHLTGELFKAAAGLDLLHVPFNGGNLAINSTVAGHTPIAFGSPAATISQVSGGKLRALAVASKARLAALSDVPTMAEAGYPDVECDAWVGCVASAGVPKEIVALLHGEMAKAVRLPDVKGRLDTLGFEAFAPSFDVSVARIRAESDKWAKLIRATGLKAG
ncbi:MAG: tripartite tricarboxylate transporter substrate binding protein [Reyranellaceae bacterium]